MRNTGSVLEMIYTAPSSDPFTRCEEWYECCCGCDS